MSINKGKDRAASLTDSTAELVTVIIVKKDTFFRIAEPDEFYKDRKKFTAYKI